MQHQIYIKDSSTKHFVHFHEKFVANRDFCSFFLCSAQVGFILVNFLSGVYSSYVFILWSTSKIDFCETNETNLTRNLKMNCSCWPKCLNLSKYAKTTVINSHISWKNFLESPFSQTTVVVNTTVSKWSDIIQYYTNRSI